MDPKIKFGVLLIIVIALIDKGAAQNTQKCGVSKISSTKDGKPASNGGTPAKTKGLSDVEFPYVQSRANRVVGGTEAQPNSWPWMAALVRGNYYICGGVLIEEQFVLTAAHCVVDRPFASMYRVVLGAHSLYEGTVHTVARVSYHPMFNKGLPPRGNDIAILRLSQKANITSPKIGLACMPTFYLTGAGGRECVVTGWGRTSEGGPPSVKLQEVKVPVLDNTFCNNHQYYGGLIGSTMLCAGWDEGGKDTCQGDSGGPLVCDVNGQWQLHGIVSWGYGCARPKKPGVYARVSVLQNWITSQMAVLRREDVD